MTTAAQFRQRKWDVRYLQMARHIGSWSKDPSTKVGAVVTRNNRIVSTGFNGFAPGEDDSPALYDDRAYKLQHIVHAEINAMDCAPAAGFTIYSSFPFCAECAVVSCRRGASRMICPPLDTTHRTRAWVDEWERQFTHALAAARRSNREIEVIDV